MLALLKKRRDLTILFTSVLISNLGTWFTYMLFVVQIFNKTKDERVTMLIVGAEALAAIIGGQVAGVIIENRNPKRILMVSDWVSAIVIASVFFLPTNVFYYSVFAFLIAFVNAFRTPSFQKYLVRTTSEDDLMQANSTLQTVNEIVKIVGPALAVTVLGILPAALENLGFIIDAVTYAIAALLLIRLIEIAMTKEVLQETKHKESWIEKWRGGLTPLKDPLVLNVFVIFLFILFGVAGADVVLTSHVSEAGLNTYKVGYVVGALSLGLLITAALAAKYVKRWPLSVQLGVSSLLLGLSYSLIGFGNSLLAMMMAAFLVGVFNAVYNMTASTFWQKVVPFELLGRFFGFVGSVFSLATLIGMTANAFISRHFTAGFDIIICGIIIALSGLVMVLNITVSQNRKPVDEHQELAK